MNKDWKLETNCIQAGYTPGNGEPRMIPIVQSTTFKYDTSAHMGALFDLEASGYFYTRLANPTSDAVAAKIAALEGGLSLIHIFSANSRRTRSSTGRCSGFSSPGSPRSNSSAASLAS